MSIVDDKQAKNNEAPVKMLPDGLYVHVPFCARRCHYCSFATVVGQENRQYELVEAVLREALRHRGRVIETVFFGGGTPNLLSPNSLKHVVEGLEAMFVIRRGCEWTIELNPERITPVWLRSVKGTPFNRFSLGVQSFDDGALRFLGRTHTAAEARDAFQRLRDNGAANINIDLIIGWPGQTKDRLMGDIEEVLRLDPEHVCLYALTIEAPSRFAAHPPSLLCDGCVRELLSAASTALRQAGFIHYEVSNFARPGRFCRHNMSVWLGGDYIGLGPAAHSRVGDFRWHNHENFFAYLKAMRSIPAEPVAAYERLSAAQRLRERLAFRLRVLDEIDLTDFPKDDQASAGDVVADRLVSWERRGWITRNGEMRFKVTDEGFWFLDTMAAELM